MAAFNLLLLVVTTLALWTSPSAALNNYNTNCTLPPANASHTFYYVSAPNVRGSLQIVWSCLLTLTICVYQVLHLVIPKQRNGRDPGWWGNIKWLGIWKDLKYALIAALAPEWILGMSIGDLLAARMDLKELHESLSGTRSTWTLTHMFYANMGGFVVVRDGEPWILLPKHIRKAIKNKLLLEEAPISAEEIMDKSKSDSFTKLISMLQILYFYVDFFARIAQDLSVTQLELGVAGVAGFSLVAYACYWHKPKSVKTPTILHLVCESHDELMAHEQVFGKDTMPMRVTNNNSSGTEWDWIIVFLGGVVLGAIHLAAWNFDFPSIADKWLWRVAGLCVTSSGVLLLALCLIDVLWVEGDSDTFNFVLGLVMLLYVVARIILIVEMIRCLFFLPPSAFQTTSWSMSIPHLG